MEIHSLKIRITDADVAAILRQVASRHDGLENVQAAITAEGVRIQGEYAAGFGFKVPFETTWQLIPAGPVVRVQLVGIKVAGFPAGMLRSVLFRTLSDAAEEVAGLSVEGEIISLNVVELAASHGVELCINCSSIELSPGSAVLVAD